ncbi:hypothetical protein B9Z55_024604 [Caenorhabditis nigoni]|uniref:Uncharacterized protein n=1 Tax=Caenorhabditis nigoni TaxID=1611254 RepID=A0A2G5SUX7_9PELO|nr:hypothetical protein B9Z55_024604 [Caenorhabditis nigoni]
MSRIADYKLCRIVDEILNKLFTEKTCFDATNGTASITPVSSNTVSSPEDGSPETKNQIIYMEVKKEMTQYPKNFNMTSNSKISENLKTFTENDPSVESEKSVIPETKVDRSNTSASSPSKGSLPDDTTIFKNSTTQGLHDVPKNFYEDFDDLWRATAGVKLTINIQQKVTEIPLPPRTLNKKEVETVQRSDTELASGAVTKIFKDHISATLETNKSRRKDLLQTSDQSLVTAVSPTSAQSPTSEYSGER